jgi:hypothetical protein
MAEVWHAGGGDFTPATRIMIQARKDGLSFGAAWPRALAAVDPDDRAILHATATAWRLEYEGQRSWGGDLVGALAVLDSEPASRSDQQLVA